MGRKKHSRPKWRWKKSSRKNIILISLTLLLVCAAAIPALAWLTARSQAENEFTVGETSVDVKEEFDGTIKKNVFIENSGNIPVYVRASVLAYWKDQDGVLLNEIPGADDYTIGWNLDNGWVQGTDGFYYYTYPVTDNTSNLIDEAKQIKEYQDGRIFCIDISAQSVQAEPYAAVLDAWKSAVVNVDEDTGELQINTGSGNTNQGGGGA